MSEKDTFQLYNRRTACQKWRAKNKEKIKVYNKQYNEKNKDKIKILQHIRNTTRIQFKEKQIDIGYSPRIGVCSKCGKSKHSKEITTTHLHHLKYDPKNPLNHTVELCIGCHNRQRRGVKYNDRR